VQRRHAFLARREGGLVSGHLYGCDVQMGNADWHGESPHLSVQGGRQKDMPIGCGRAETDHDPFARVLMAIPLFCRGSPRRS